MRLRLLVQPLPLGRVHGPVARLADWCNNSTTAFIIIVMYLLLRRHSTAAALTNCLRFVLQRGSLEGVIKRGSNGCVCIILHYFTISIFHILFFKVILLYIYYLLLGNYFFHLIPTFDTCQLAYLPATSDRTKCVNILKFMHALHYIRSYKILFQGWGFGVKR